MENTQRQYPPEHRSSSAKPDAKVAIPRLQNTHYALPAPVRPQRPRTDVVSKACSQCRKRKIKCSGDRPRCINCQRQGQDHPCHYEQERKDRLRGAIQKTKILTELLIEVSSQLDERGKKKVEDTLASFEDDATPPLASTVPLASQSKRQRQVSYFDDDAISSPSVDAGEAHIATSAGSDDDLEFAQEDLLRTSESDSAGFMGRNSQAQWLRALEAKVEGEPPHWPLGPSADTSDQQADALHGRQQKASHTQGNQNSATSYYFYLDKTNIDIEVGDPNILPSASTAQRLFGYYKHAVHSPFKLIDDEFEQQLQQVYFNGAENKDATNVCPKWRAGMNLVFAIGARYSHLAGSEWRADDRDHLVYMWRAIHLLQFHNMKSLAPHPDQRLIQAIGLLSFYYLTIGHVSRAWFMIGMAIRHAQAAGLHLRYDNPSIQHDKRKPMAELWWALNSVECVLTTILGRPRAISAKDCTILPPGDVKAETERKSRRSTAPDIFTASSSFSSNSFSSSGGQSARHQLDSFSTAYVRLDILMDKILSGLYSPRKSIQSWKGAQGMIESLSEELQTWALQSLPQGPSAAVAATMGHSLDRESLLLYLYYYNAKICITRPCLCKMDERTQGQSEQSSRFIQKTADTCIGAALNISSLLPDVPNSAWYYENGPWWCATHMIMQALTVLLIELSLNCVHLTFDKSHIMTCVNKLIKWLESMKTVDAVSEGAYNVVTKVLRKQSSDGEAKRQMPYVHSAEERMQQELGTMQQAPGLPQTYQMPIHPHALQHMDNAWPGSEAANIMPYFSQPDTASFYQQSFPSSEYLAGSNAGLYEFGQPQMSLFYGNPYTAVTHQWDWESMTVDDGGQRNDPLQYQGQNLGGGPPHS